VKLIPDRLSIQVPLVLLLGLSISHALSLAFYYGDKSTALESAGEKHIGEQIKTIVRIAERLPEAERPRIVELAQSKDLELSYSKSEVSPLPKGKNWQSRAFSEALSAHFSTGRVPEFSVHFIAVDSPEWAKANLAGHTQSVSTDRAIILASVQLSERGWLNFTGHVEPADATWSYRFILSLTVMLFAVFLFAIIVVRHMTAPFRHFSDAADRFGSDLDAPPLRLDGSSEVQNVVQAFNTMQARIRKIVADRTRMIAAISHDLRTPITRLRLRAEMTEDHDQQRKIYADLDEMESMIASVIAFAREETDRHEMERIDAKALIQSICDDANDAGHEVHFVDSGLERIPIVCDRLAVRRAITNIVMNAVRYGGSARVDLVEEHGHIHVLIDDDGPGIPKDQMDLAFEPFTRLEGSRNRDTGGTGLGLYIARSVVVRHGGVVSLTNRPEGGLRVEIDLPRTQELTE